MSILKTKIQQSQVTFDEVIQKLSEALGFKVQKIKSGMFRIGEEGYVGQDSKAIYKVCSGEGVKGESDCDDSSLNTSDDYSRRQTILDEDMMTTRRDNTEVEKPMTSETKLNGTTLSSEKNLSFSNPFEAKWSSSSTEATIPPLELRSSMNSQPWRFQNMPKQEIRIPITKMPENINKEVEENKFDKG